MAIVAGTLAVFISLFFATCSIYFYKKPFNPMFIMDVLFGPMIFLSLFNFLGFFAVSVDLYLILALAITFYNIGCMIPSVNEPKKLVFIRQNSYFEHRQSVEIIMFIFDVVLLIIGIIEVINVSYYYINGYASAHIRGVYFQGSMSLIYGTNKLWQVVRTYITSPLTLVVIAISSIWLIEYKKMKQFVVAMIILLLQIVVSFSRFFVLYIVIALLTSYYAITYFFIDYAGVSIKMKRTVKRLSAVGVLGIIGVSFARGVEGLLTSFYEYYCGCIFLINQLMNEIPKDKTLGMVSFQGFIAPIYFVLHQIFNVPYSNAYINAINVLGLKSSAHVISETGLKTNAFGTMVYPLLCDYGWIGIPFGMLIFGFFAGLLYRKMVRLPNERNIAIYIIVVIAIIKSIQDYPFSTSTLILPVFIIWIIYRKD